MAKRHLEFIRVKRGGRNYRIYLKDIKSALRVPKKQLPPVPAFEAHDHLLSLSLAKREDQESVKTAHSIANSLSGSGSFDF